MVYVRSTVGRLICLIGISFVVASVGFAQQIIKRSSSIALSPYAPKEVESLSELPDAISAKVRDHLVERLGDTFYSQLKFQRALIVDFEELYRVAPWARAARWEIFAYKLEYEFARRDLGIKSYGAEIWLRRDGTVIREIDLPNIRRDPKKSTLIPVKEAIQVSKMNKFRPESIELAYRTEEDSIAWRMVRQSRDGTTWWLYISAHDGTILDKVGFTGIQ
jgi:hypothetical protein